MALMSLFNFLLEIVQVCLKLSFIYFKRKHIYVRMIELIPFESRTFEAS